MKTILFSLIALHISPYAHAATNLCANSLPDRDTIYDRVSGQGAVAVSGKKLTVHYVGRLCNGTIFDSTIKSNKPFTFDLGTGQVIKGWDQGFTNMQVGGHRRIVIPAELAYGDNEVGAIPKNSRLVFDITLLDVK